jgi:short-subunit dehydrogenase
MSRASAIALDGAVVVVTGASRGIGQATAELLAASGAHVVCVGRDAAALNAVALRTGGSSVVLDVTTAGSDEAIVAHAVARWGRLDAVVVNAGIGYVGAFADMPAASIVELIDVNVRAPIMLARVASGALIESARAGRGAAIVFVSSIAGAVGVPEESVYSATKATLDMFAVCLGEELRPHGVVVSVVVPGVVDTAFHTGRAEPYGRRFPRPMAPQRVAREIVGLLESGRPRVVVPRWLTAPAHLAGGAPGLYRRLARRFG